MKSAGQKYCDQYQRVPDDHPGAAFCQRFAQALTIRDQRIVPMKDIKQAGEIRLQ
jgi:hypothetical protein